jgi:non-specific serine/threonine protein kinase
MEFDDVAVDLDAFRVLKRGRAVAVEPKAFDVLRCLLGNPGTLVTKDRLLTTVWPDTFVAPNTLTRIIAQLRRALGDRSRSPRYIETVHTRGYRFIAPLRGASPAPGRGLNEGPAVSLRGRELSIGVSPLIGRETERAAIVNAFAQSRLVTLVGAGGVGKTQLGLEAARGMAASFASVSVVDLAPYRSDTDVPSIVAATLDLGDDPATTGSVRVARLLHDRHLLLVLDNCEHLAASCGDLVATLLGGCPNVHILATSQRSLGVAGETILSVPPLAVPSAADVDGDAASLTGIPSVRLFLDRARAAQPSFSPAGSITTIKAIARICQRLDGIPLALEMAAARMNVLSAEQLAARLDDRFALLTDGSRTLGRHETLRAALDWSYALLPERERALLGRLGVFAGGWSLEAAESVCAGDAMPPPALVDALAGLVARSFVSAEPTGDRYRYKLHDTTRAYAREQLEASGRAGEVRARHFNYYLQVACAADREQLGTGQSQWLSRIDAEQGNLAAAYDWGLRRGGGRALRLATALHWYWRSRSRFVEARSWFARGLAAGRRATRRERADALVALASVEVSLLCPDEALQHVREALALSGPADRRLRAKACLVRAVAAQDARRGNSAAREALRLANAVNDNWLVGSAYVAAGLRAALQREPRVAARQFAEARRHLEATGDRWLIKYATIYEGLQRHLLGDQPRAAALIEQGLAIATELQDRRAMAAGLEVFAYVAVKRGANDLACRLLGCAESIRQSTGVPLAQPWTAINEVARERLRRRLGRRFSHARARGQRALLPSLIDEAVAHLAAAGTSRSAARSRRRGAGASRHAGRGRG